MIRAYTTADLVRAHQRGDVTPNGVAFTDVLAGPQGASFTLFREPHHDPEDLRLAARQLRNLRDVVGPVDGHHQILNLELSMTLHTVVFKDDFGNEEQRALVDGHIVPIRLFDRNAFYLKLFRAVEQAIARGLTTGTVTENPFHHWKVV